MLGRKLNTELTEALKDADVLLIPAGGGRTIPLAETAEVVSQLEPKIVIPMQYAVPGVSVTLEPIERFCREMAVQEPRFLPRLTVTRSSLPDDATVVLLEATAARRGV